MAELLELKRFCGGRWSYATRSGKLQKCPEDLVWGVLLWGSESPCRKLLGRDGWNLWGDLGHGLWSTVALQGLEGLVLQPAHRWVALGCGFLGRESLVANNLILHPSVPCRCYFILLHECAFVFNIKLARFCWIRPLIKMSVHSLCGHLKPKVKLDNWKAQVLTISYRSLNLNSYLCILQFVVSRLWAHCKKVKMKVLVA